MRPDRLCLINGVKKNSLFTGIGGLFFVKNSHLSGYRALLPDVLQKIIIRLGENSVQSIIIYYISFHTVNVSYILLYSFPTCYWMICQDQCLIPSPMDDTTKSCIYCYLYIIALLEPQVHENNIQKFSSCLTENTVISLQRPVG
jgi:hypothetical protein